MRLRRNIEEYPVIEYLDALLFDRLRDVWILQEKDQRFRLHRRPRYRKRRIYLLAVAGETARDRSAGTEIRTGKREKGCIHIGSRCCSSIAAIVSNSILIAYKNACGRKYEEQGSKGGAHTESIPFAMFSR